MIEKILISSIAGLLGLIPVLLQLVGNKARYKSNSNQLNRLQVELNCLEKLQNLSSHIPDHNFNENADRVSNIINNSLTSMLERYRALTDYEQKFTESKRITNIKKIFFLRRMFLLFRPQSVIGWFLHSLFHIFIIMSIAIIISGYISPTYDQVTGKSEFIYILIGVLAVLGIPMIVLQRLAIRNLKRVIAKGIS